jgi:hypothetical protein
MVSTGMEVDTANIIIMRSAYNIAVFTL